MDNFNREIKELETSKPSLQDALGLLEETPESKSSTVSYGLSGLATADDIQAFKSFWQRLGTERRQHLISHLVDVSEVNFELDYAAIGFIALDDEDERVRAMALDLLWENESLALLEELVSMAQWDVSDDVRASALSALGRFVLLGEYGKLTDANRDLVQETAIQVWNNEAEVAPVRRRAMEAIANSSHSAVSEIIDEGYNSADSRLVVGAVYAMGRTCDPIWAETVLKELSSSDPAIRYEAARASGELGLEEALPTLGRLALKEDRDIQETAIWAIGEIGGVTAIDLLEGLAEQLDEDGDWDEIFEDAIGNANLAAGVIAVPDLPDLYADEDK